MILRESTSGPVGHRAFPAEQGGPVAEWAGGSPVHEATGERGGLGSIPGRGNFFKAPAARAP